MSELRMFLEELNSDVTSEAVLCCRENLRRLAAVLYRRLNDVECYAAMLQPSRWISGPCVDYVLVLRCRGKNYVLNPHAARGKLPEGTAPLPQKVWDLNGAEVKDALKDFATSRNRSVIGSPELISGRPEDRILCTLAQPDLKLPPAPVEMEKPAVSSIGRLSLDEIDRRFCLPRYSHEHETGPPEVREEIHLLIEPAGMLAGM